METKTTELLFSAKDAIELTNKKAITTQGICTTIKNQADCGMNRVTIINHMMPFNVIRDLIELGFNISQTTNPFG